MLIKEEFMDLTEEAIDFVPPILHQNGISYGKTKESKELLRSQGIVIRDGLWTQEEDAILLKNWEDFMGKTDIKDPMLLLGVTQNSGNKGLIRKFTTAKKLLVRLGRGLNNRTLYSIYLRARVILNPARNNGKLTSDEVNKLMKLVARYGCNFVQIGSLIGKTASACREAYRWHRKKVKHGPWTAEEDLALQKAIEMVCLKQTTSTLPWKRIAACVPRRNDSQCRTHWFQKLCKEKEVKWTKENDACLIYWMYTDFPKHKDKVDWHSLYEKFSECATSFITLQRKWVKLKMLTQQCKREHKHVVRYLYMHYLPTLLEQLGLSMKSLELLAHAKQVTYDVHKGISSLSVTGSVSPVKDGGKRAKNDPNTDNAYKKMKMDSSGQNAAVTVETLGCIPMDPVPYPSGAASENHVADHLHSPAVSLSRSGDDSSPFSSHRSHPNWWKSVETVSVSVGHQNTEPTYLDDVVKHFVPYKFRLFVTVLNVEPQSDSIMKLIRLYCPKCHYLSEDSKPDLEIYQMRNKIPLYLCPKCSSAGSPEDDECPKQVLVYTFVTSFTLSDGTSTVEAYMWKKNAVMFFKGIKPEDVLVDGSKAVRVHQMLWDICPNCRPSDSESGTSSPNNKNDSYYPVLDCCIMSYTAAGETRYQIFDTRLK